MTEREHSAQTWPSVYIPRGERVIVTLHGFGGNEQEISQLATWLDPEASVLSPRGRKVLHGSHYWWGTLTDDGFRPDDIEQRAAQLHDYLHARMAEMAVAPTNVVVAGFSNGAAMALALGVLYPTSYPHVCAFSGWLPFAAINRSDLHGLTVWFSHGDSDPWVSHKQSTHALTSLQEAGATLGSLVRTGGHTITPDEIEGAREFLAL